MTQDTTSQQRSVDDPLWGAIAWGGPPRRWLWRLGWLPIPILLLTLAVLWKADLQRSYESPFLLMVLNLVFATLVSLLIAHLIGRSFRVRSTPGLLLLGCGMVAWACAGLVAVVAGIVIPAGGGSSPTPP